MGKRVGHALRIARLRKDDGGGIDAGGDYDPFAAEKFAPEQLAPPSADAISDWATNWQRPADRGNVRFTTASPYANITDQDIDRGIGVAMSAGTGTMKQPKVTGRVAPSGMNTEDFTVNPDKAANYRGPAMLWKGKVIEGDPGKDYNHADIAEKHGFPKDMVPGFVTKDGEFHYQYPEDVPPSGIKAYHGSPHDFDAFDLSKIGTGEGAQAYGHGLYFAENENVARGYRDNLSQGLATATQPRIPVGDVDYAIMEAGRKAGDIPQQRLDTLSTNITEALRMGIDPREAAMSLAKTDKERAAAEAMLEAGKQYFPSAPGKMYEVSIDADPEHFLDWDKKVRDMTPEMQQRLMDQGLAAPHGGDIGSQVYHRRVDEFGQEAATQQLRDAGIPGIKYLDQGSRSAGEGSRNYVVFDHNLINILRKYGIVGAPAAAMAARIARGSNDTDMRRGGSVKTALHTAKL